MKDRSPAPEIAAAADNVTTKSVSLTLTPEEIFEITGYRRGREQLAWFKALGVPARRRADGTVSVAREHYSADGLSRASAATTVKSSPRLRLE